MRVLATTDGSEFSRQVLVQMGRLLPPGTEVVLVMVYPPPLSPGHGQDTVGVDLARVTDQLQDEAEDAVREGKEILEGHGFRVTPLTLPGKPEDVILAIAKLEKPDLLVVGSHGKTGLQRFLLGSVSERMLKYAPFSTLVIKPPMAAEAQEPSLMSQSPFAPRV